MKRFTFVAVTLCLAFMMAVPAMAVEVDISGTYRARGIAVQDQTMRSNTGSTDASMDMRLRVQTVFKVSDDLKVTVRFDALDKQWGTSDSVSATTTNATVTAVGGVGHTHTATTAQTFGNNIDFDRAYMTFNTGIGKFDIGRMAGGTWAGDVFDTAYDSDRIKFTTKLGDLILIYIFQKHLEADAGGIAGTNADSDYDIHWIAPIYKTESWSAGVLAGYARSMGSSDTNVASTQFDTNVTIVVPYFKGKFGNFSVFAELFSLQGDASDYDIAGSPTDVDKDELAYNVELGLSLGAVNLELGYVFTSGDDGTNAAEDSSFTYGTGDEWEKMFILNGSTGGFTGAGVLGGLGNLSQNGAIAHGTKQIYGGASFAVNDQLNVGVLLSYAEADETPALWKDEYGSEIDLIVKYKLMDNLNYTFKAAFLDAGDYYYGATGVAPANFEDVTAFWHVLQVNF